MSDLVGNPEDRFSHNEAHFVAQYIYLLRLGAMPIHLKIAEVKSEGVVNMVLSTCISLY